MTITLNPCNRLGTEVVVPCSECCGTSGNYDCEMCFGSGYKDCYDPFSLTMSNRNFYHFWRVIFGTEPEHAGEISVDELLRACSSYIPGLGVKASDGGIGSTGARFYESGVTEEQMHRYISKVKEICREFLEREVSTIAWG